MHRIASALLIVAAVLALNAGMVREAFSAEPAAPAIEAPSRSAKLLSLLVVLESLRQAPLVLDRPKV